MKKIEKDPTRGYVLAEGEVTGHYHSIMENVDMYEDDNGLKYMTTFGPVTVKHQEHNPITVEEIGDFTVDIVREQDHLKDMARKVQD